MLVKVRGKKREMREKIGCNLHHCFFTSETIWDARSNFSLLEFSQIRLRILPERHSSRRLTERSCAREVKECRSEINTTSQQSSQVKPLPERKKMISGSDTTLYTHLRISGPILCCLNCIFVPKSFRLLYVQNTKLPRNMKPPLLREVETYQHAMIELYSDLILEQIFPFWSDMICNDIIRD